MVTFILVHGGSHGGWCFSRVKPLLEARGHCVFTPTLSGLAERAHLAATQQINLSTHIQDVVEVIKLNDVSNIVLCGHSYGGMVITGVAGQLSSRVHSLVYLDALVPDRDNQSMLDILGPERAMTVLGWAGRTGTVADPPATDYFEVYGDDAKWVERMCTPHPVGCFIQKLRLTGEERLVNKRTYVLAKRHESTNHETYARLKERSDWRTIALDCGHDMMVTNADMLAQLLLGELSN